MKWLKRIILVVVLLLVVVLVTAMFFLGSVVKNAAETFGPEVLGVDVKLASAKVFPLRGKVRLKGLLIGNPEGFKTPSMFEMGELAVDIDVKSVFTDRVIIDRILIDAPKITFEGSLKGSNISRLLEGLDSGEEEPPAEEEAVEAEEQPASEGGGKKVQINEFVLQDAQVNLSMSLMGGKSIPIPMPTLRKEGIGAEDGGASVQDITKEVFSLISQGVLEAVKSSGALLGKGAEAVGDLAGEGLDAAAKAAEEAMGAASEMVGEGVGAASEMVGEGVGAASDIAGEGVEKAGEAVGAVAGKSAEVVGDVAGKSVEAAGAAADKVGDALGDGAKKLKEGFGGLLKKKD